MFLICLMLAVTATTTTISGEGTTSVVAALMEVIGDDLLPEFGQARAFAADTPLPTTTICYVSNATTDLLHVYALALKTGPAPGPADPPVPTIVGGSPRIVPTTMVSLICSHGRTPTNYVSELPLSVGNLPSVCVSKQNRLVNYLLRYTPLPNTRALRSLFCL